MDRTAGPGVAYEVANVAQGVLSRGFARHHRLDLRDLTDVTRKLASVRPRGKSLQEVAIGVDCARRHNARYRSLLVKRFRHVCASREM